MLRVVALLFCVLATQGAVVKIEGTGAQISLGGDTSLRRTGVNSLTASGGLLLDGGTFNVISALAAMQTSIDNVQSMITALNAFMYPPYVNLNAFANWMTGPSIEHAPRDHSNFEYYVKYDGNQKYLYTEVPLIAGSYSMKVTYFAMSDRGTVLISLDNAQIGTFNGYIAGSTPTRTTYTTQVEVATSGRHNLRFQVSGSTNSGYVLALALVEFTFVPAA